MNSVRKMHEALKDNPELQRKIYEEAVRLAESGEADGQEALGRAVRENLGIEITREELDALFLKAKELDPEALAEAGGGNSDGAKLWGATGASFGAFAGAAAGMAVPVIGTAVGGCIGAVIGGVAGGVLGFFFSDGPD